VAGIGATNLLNALAGQPPLAVVDPRVLGQGPYRVPRESRQPGGVMPRAGG
jgi:hypothetical protein